jgi:hypothetical protein
MPLLFLDIIDQRALNPDKELRAHLQSMAIISNLRLIDIKYLVFFTKTIATVRV